MNHNALNILLIEDTPSDAALVRKILQPTFPTVTWVQSLTEATTALDETEFGIVLADLGLPDSSGLDTVTRLVDHSSACPIIVLTGQDDDSLGVKAIHEGAADYLPKTQLNAAVIHRTIPYAIERFRLTKQNLEANRSLQAKNERLAKMYQMSQQFVDNVSHEFRTPLTVIREFASIIRDGIDGPVTEPQKNRLNTLVSRADDLSSMVNDLLDTSRLEAGLIKTCRKSHNVMDIVTKVEKMLQSRAAGKNITLVSQCDSDDLVVFCDEEKLGRVLINLIVNAIKFTPEGGRIQVSATQADKDRIQISVSDNGPGIAPDDLTRIFERFQQAEAHHRMAACKGFGLGLSIARSLATLNLGSLKVESEQGKGSQFSVMVPVANVASILECYFDQRIATRSDGDKISALQFTLDVEDLEDEEDAIETIDEFLRSSIKSYDLVLRTQPQQWVIYTCNSLTEVEGFQERIRSEWDELRRNYFGPSLPDLDIEHKITIDVARGRAALERQAMPEAETSEELPTESLTAETRSNRLVLMEDESDVADALRSRLLASGYEVEVAHDGMEGLAAVKRVKPNVIVLDVRMPRMDGLTVLDHLRDDPQLSETPVVVLSASLPDKHAALERGAKFFIQKPFQSEELLKALDRTVGDTIDEDDEDVEFDLECVTQTRPNRLTKKKPATNTREFAV